MEVSENEPPPYFDPTSALKPSATDQLSKSNSKGFLQCFPYMVVRERFSVKLGFRALGGSKYDVDSFSGTSISWGRGTTSNVDRYFALFGLWWAFLAMIRFSAVSFSNPLVIPQIGKKTLILPPL